MNRTTITAKLVANGFSATELKTMHIFDVLRFASDMGLYNCTQCSFWDTANKQCFNSNWTPHANPERPACGLISFMVPL